MKCEINMCWGLAQRRGMGCLLWWSPRSLYFWKNRILPGSAIYATILSPSVKINLTWCLSNISGANSGLLR